MKMRKLVAALLAVLMLCSIIPFSAVAADSSVTIDFTDKANRTAYSTEQQVWEQNGIIVTNDKGASTSNVGDYGGEGYPARFYKSSTVKIEYPGMTKIVIDCTGLEAKYVDGWTNSFSADATATKDGSIITIVLAAASDAFVWEKMSAQSRANNITVYTAEGGAPVVPPVEPDEPDQPDLSTVEKIIAAAMSLKDGESLQQEVSLIGKVLDIETPYDATFDNITVNIVVNDLTIKCYRLSGTGVANIQPGDTITVKGTIKNYMGIIEFDTGCKMTQHVTGTNENKELTVVANPQVGVAYKFGMLQKNIASADVYYLKGGMSGYYMATSSSSSAALDVYLEETNGGYYLYAVVNGVKLYINMVISADGAHVNGAYESAASTVYTYDFDRYTLVSEINGELYAFGTRNDKQYTTMGPVKVSYNGFHAGLYYFEDDVEKPCEHAYDNACDADCNLCGEQREVGDHEYDNAYDANCNHCGFVRDLPIYGGIISVVQNSAHAGENVNLSVQVDGNPGIVSAKVKVHFDNTLLEFVSAVEGNFSASGYSWSDFETVQEKGYLIINWCDATNPNSMANLLATLTFKVKEDAPVGFANVWVEFNCEDDVFNADDKTVYFDAAGGGVEILETVEVLIGDVNGDGKRNNRDLGLLMQKLNGFDVAVDEIASDMNGDGKLNNRDLGLLQQALNA